MAAAKAVNIETASTEDIVAAATALNDAVAGLVEKSTEVATLIGEIPNDPTSADGRAAVQAARAAYDALSDAQKAKVPENTLKKLTDAEKAIAIADLNAAITAAETKQGEAGYETNYTRVSRDAVAEALAAAQGVNTTTASTAEIAAAAAALNNAVAKLVEKTDDHAAAEATEDLIEAIPGGVTAENALDHADAINAAKAAYDALTDAQKALVGDAYVQKLNAAVEALEAAQLAAAKADATTAVNAVNASDYIESDQATVTGAKETALAAINSATTTAEVTTALETFNATIANCTTQAAADLAAAKEAATTAVNAVDAEAYIAADQATVASAKTTALGAIAAATTPAEVQEALDTFNDAIANCTTQAAADLAAAKEAATTAVNAVDAEAYIADDQQTVSNAKTAALEAIESAATIAEVDAAVAAFNNAIKDCTTQKDADDKAAADAVSETIEALPDEITEENARDNADAIRAAKEAYDALTDDQKALVDPALVQKLNDAEAALDAADLAAAKEEAKKELDSLLAGKKKSDDSPENWAALRKAVEDGKKAIDAATTIEDVAKAKTAAADKANAIKKKDGKVPVTTVTVNAKTVSAKAIDKAVAKAGASKEDITTIILGKKVKKIKKGAFKQYRNAKTLVVKTKKLKKSKVKKSLKGSAIQTVKVQVGKKAKVNKKYVKKYRKIFRKKNSGKKVRVIR